MAYFVVCVDPIQQGSNETPPNPEDYVLGLTGPFYSLKQAEMHVGRNEDSYFTMKCCGGQHIIRKAENPTI